VREAIQQDEPHITVSLGTLLELHVSARLVFSMHGTFQQHSDELAWRYELLYDPTLVPFVLASLVTVFIHRKQLPARLSPMRPS
jgi:L-lactate permease